MLRLIGALALLGLLAPTAVAEHQTQVRSFERTIVYEARNQTPSSCRAAAFVMWPAQPGTVSATVHFTNAGSPLSITGTPPFSNEYVGFRVPRGNDWISLRTRSRVSESPTNCQDEFPEMRERFAPGTARVEVTVRVPHTGTPSRPGSPAGPGRPAIQAAQVLTSRHLQTQRTRATLRLRVSAPGRASTLLTRSLPGIRRGSACVPVPRRRPAGARPCVRQVQVGGPIVRTLSRAGSHDIVLRAQGLPAGRYRTATSLVSNGTRTAPRIVNFVAPNWPSPRPRR